MSNKNKKINVMNDTTQYFTEDDIFKELSKLNEHDRISKMYQAINIGTKNNIPYRVCLGSLMGYENEEGKRNTYTKKTSIKLAIGMHVKINKDHVKHHFDSAKVKEITKILPIYECKRAFELDNDGGIWCLEDFEKCMEYPTLEMQ